MASASRQNLGKWAFTGSLCSVASLPPVPYTICALGNDVISDRSLIAAHFAVTSNAHFHLCVGSNSWLSRFRLGAESSDFGWRTCDYSIFYYLSVRAFDCVTSATSVYCNDTHTRTVQWVFRRRTTSEGKISSRSTLNVTAMTKNVSSVKFKLQNSYFFG